MWLSPKKPTPPKASTRPRRQPQRPEQEIPKGDRFDWAPERELVRGIPRADRKARGHGNA
jgi:hypothetical protein